MSTTEASEAGPAPARLGQHAPHAGTEGAEGSEPTARPSRRGWLGALVVVAVVAAGVAAFAATADTGVSRRPDDPVVARLLSLQTGWGVSRRSGREGEAVVATSSQVGSYVQLSPQLSRAFRVAIEDLLGDRDTEVWQRSRVVRSLTRQRNADGSVEATTAVTVFSPRGVHLIGFVDDQQTDLVFQPALRVLPANPRPGARWSSDGTIGSQVPYSYRVRATDPGPVRTVAGRRTGCVRLAVDYRVGDRRNRSRETLCPGVGSVGEVAADRTVELVAAVGHPARRPLPGPRKAEGRGGQEAPGGEPSSWVVQPWAQLSDQLVDAPTAPVRIVGGRRPLAVGTDERSRLLRTFATEAPGRAGWAGGLAATPRGRIGVDPEDGAVYVGTPSREVYAFDRDGLLRWVARSGDNVAAAPVRAGRLVVVAGEDGRVTALDRRTGRPVWRAGLGSPSVTDPAVIGGTVVVGTDDGTVHALRSRDGAGRWTADAGGPVAAGIGSVDGDALVATTTGDVVRYDAEDGAERWRAAVRVGVATTPMATGRLVVVVAGGDVVGLAAGDGHERWRRSGLAAVGPAVAAGDRVVVALRAGGFVALDEAGRVVRRWSTASQRDVPVGGGVLAGTMTYGATAGAGAVWGVDDDGTIWRLGPRHGPSALARSWTQRLNELHADVRMAAAAVDGRSIVLVDDLGSISRLDPATGTRTPIASGVAGPKAYGAAVAGGVAYVDRRDGLAAVDLRTGRRRWDVAHGPTLGSPPVLWQGLVAVRTVGDTSELLLVDQRTGAVAARVPTGADPVAAPPARCGAGLLVPVTGAGALLLGPDRTPTPIVGIPTTLRSAACDAFGRRAVVTATEGRSSTVVVVDLTTGHVAGTTPLPGLETAGWDPPLFVGGTVVVPTLGTTLVGVDFATGAVRWRHETPSSRTAGVRIVDGRVWVADRHGVVQVLDARSGRLLAAERGLGALDEGVDLALGPFAAGRQVVVVTGGDLWAIPRRLP